MPIFVPRALNNLRHHRAVNTKSSAQRTTSTSWLHLVILVPPGYPGSSWFLLVPPGYPGSSWFLLVILAPPGYPSHPGSSWLPWSSWLLLVTMALPSSYLPGYPGSSWLSWLLLLIMPILLAPPGSSWLLLAPPGSSWLPGSPRQAGIPNHSRPPRFFLIFIFYFFYFFLFFFWGGVFHVLLGSARFPGLPYRPFVEGPGYPGSSWLLLVFLGSAWFPWPSL
jgi:hypothetical protein